MWIAKDWSDYRILDCGGGEKVEKWADYTLVRPDPQAIWNRTEGVKAWDKANPIYHLSKSGGGQW